MCYPHSTILNEKRNGYLDAECERCFRSDKFAITASKVIFRSYKSESSVQSNTNMATACIYSSQSGNC